MSPAAGPVRVSRFCMATRFEIALYGAEADRLRAAGEVALEEVEAAEDKHSHSRRRKASKRHKPTQQSQTDIESKTLLNHSSHCY